ncbi:MAG: hypothetical protein J6N99_01515, partial [Schwartzia sp.]|nr:hypothetical protein [Schwartzia sp. (in: firmicutes)]
GDEPEPASIRLADIDPERFHLRFLRVRGLVMDAVEDDIDPDYEALISPTAIPSREFEKYKHHMAYYKNILKEGLRIE